MPEPDQPSPQVSSGDTSVDPDAPVAKPADVAPAIDAEELLRRAELKAQEHTTPGSGPRRRRKYPQADGDRACKRLQVRDRGRRRGAASRQGQPGSDARGRL